MNRRRIVIGIVAALTLALDLGSKLWAQSALRGADPLVLLPRYLQLEYHENSGMAFGLGRNLPGARAVLVGVGVLVLFLVWRIVRQVERRQGVANVAFALVVGGAVGNIVDRLRQGRVVDFVVMHWQHRYVWPAYNVADVALCVGVGLLLLTMGSQPAAGRRR